MSHSSKIKNNSKLSIVIETWHDHSYGLSRMHTFIMHPQESTNSFSSTGEWYITNNFRDKSEIKFKQEWMDFYNSKMNDNDDKIIYPNRLGKFRDKPSVGGDYSWMDTNYFQANYVDCVIIFEEYV